MNLFRLEAFIKIIRHAEKNKDTILASLLCQLATEVEDNKEQVKKEKK